MTNIRNVPSEHLEGALGFDLRHKEDATMNDCVQNILTVTGQLAYATADGSWGELEKHLTIILRNYIRFERALVVLEKAGIIGSDAVIRLGEEYWAGRQAEQDSVNELSHRIFSRTVTNECQVEERQR